MEEFEESSKLGIGNGEVRAKFRRLESGMEKFETRSKFGIGNGGVRAKFRRLESGMEEFEESSMLRIGNGGVRAKFEAWNRKWRRSSQVPTLEIGNGGVRAKLHRGPTPHTLLWIPDCPSDSWKWGLPTAATVLIPYPYRLSFNLIKLALEQAGTQLLQFSLLLSVP